MPAPFRSWALDVDPGAVAQMEDALRLPSAVRGALMPDAHRGYGLPIGGVLATEGTVIPYAVGVDIACRMKLTVLDLPPAALDEHPGRLEQALLRETQFGTGAVLRRRADHAVLDQGTGAGCACCATCARRPPASSARPAPATTSSSSACCSSSRPTSASRPAATWRCCSHSGSRGSGAQIAGALHEGCARDLHPELPKELSHLAWLDLDSEPGRSTGRR